VVTATLGGVDGAVTCGNARARECAVAASECAAAFGTQAVPTSGADTCGDLVAFELVANLGELPAGAADACRAYAQCCCDDTAPLESADAASDTTTLTCDVCRFDRDCVYTSQAQINAVDAAAANIQLGGAVLRACEHGAALRTDASGELTPECTASLARSCPPLDSVRFQARPGLAVGSVDARQQALDTLSIGEYVVSQRWVAPGGFGSQPKCVTALRTLYEYYDEVLPCDTDAAFDCPLGEPLTQPPDFCVLNDDGDFNVGCASLRTLNNKCSLPIDADVACKSLLYGVCGATFNVAARDEQDPTDVDGYFFYNVSAVTVADGGDVLQCRALPTVITDLSLYKEGGNSVLFGGACDAVDGADGTQCDFGKCTDDLTCEAATGGEPCDNDLDCVSSTCDPPGVCLADDIGPGSVRRRQAAPMTQDDCLALNSRGVTRRDQEGAPCWSDDDCGDPSDVDFAFIVCNARTNRCFNRVCAVDADCAFGVCKAEVMYPFAPKFLCGPADAGSFCDDDLDCPVGVPCRWSDNTCADPPTCTDSSQCGSRRCVNDQCLQPSGGACSQASDCASNVCNSDSRCAAIPNGHECYNSNSNCNSSAACTIPFDDIVTASIGLPSYCLPRLGEACNPLLTQQRDPMFQENDGANLECASGSCIENGDGNFVCTQLPLGATCDHIEAMHGVDSSNLVQLASWQTGPSECSPPYRCSVEQTGGGPLESRCRLSRSSSLHALAKRCDATRPAPAIAALLVALLLALDVALAQF